MPDLTVAMKAKFDALRLVYLGPDAQAQLIRYQNAGTYTNIGNVLLENWNASRSKYIAGKNTLIFDYADVDKERIDDLIKSTGVIVRMDTIQPGIVYKFADKDAPVGLTQTWSIALVPTGEFETS